MDRMVNVAKVVAVRVAVVAVVVLTLKEQKTNEDIWKYAFRQGIIGLGISCITGWTNHSYE